MMQHIIKGWLTVTENSEGEEVLYIGNKRHNEPLAEVVADLLPCIATIRYYISSEEVSLEKAAEYLLGQYYGKLEADYTMHYSEYTGYLWTDEELKVGGHDLLTELKQYTGKFLILVIDLLEGE